MRNNSSPSASQRNRTIYGAVTAGVMLAGFLSRRLFGQYEFIRLYVGDVLWAMMVFFGLAFIFCKWPVLKVAVAALGFSVCIEIGQLYHAPWIDALRQTHLGGLILGFTFVWSDLICYAVGVGIGVMIEVAILSGPGNKELRRNSKSFLKAAAREGALRWSAGLEA